MERISERWRSQNDGKVFGRENDFVKVGCGRGSRLVSGSYRLLREALDCLNTCHHSDESQFLTTTVR